MEFLSSFVEVFLCAVDQAELYRAFHLSLRIFHLLGQFQILFDKYFHFILVLTQIFCPNPPDVSNCQRLATQIGHLNRVLECVLKPIYAIAAVTEPIIAETQIN